MAIIVVRPLPNRSQAGKIREELKRRRARRKVILTHQLEDVCGLTLTGLAARTGVDRSYISRIFSGARVPSLDTSIRLAGALQMTLQEFADVVIPPAQMQMIDEVMGETLREKPTVRMPRRQTELQRKKIREEIGKP